MSILDMSKGAAPLIIMVLIVRALGIHRLPKQTFLALWAVALARLLVPVALPFQWNLASLVAWLDGILSGLAPVPGIIAQAAPQPPVVLPPVNVPLLMPAIGVPLVSPVIARPDTNWLLWGWLLGALAVAVYFLATYVRCHRHFRMSLPVEAEGVRRWLAENPIRRPVQVRQTDRMVGPLTYGILRPVILLPKSALRLPPERLQYILTHELVHIRHFDALRKLVLAAAVCIHWFNPLVWVLYILANRDIELACDEGVVRRLGDSLKSSYALTLLGMAERQSCPTQLYSSFSKYAIEERINAIMRTQKHSMLATVLALALVLVMTLVFMTTAVATEAGTDAPETTEAYSITIQTDEGVSYVTPQNLVPAGQPATAWYTYDEYKAWVEAQREALQALVGTDEVAFTPAMGTFAWTQDMVDAVLAQYEGTLETIRQGGKVARPAEAVQISLHAEPAQFAPVTVTTMSDTAVAISPAQTAAAMYPVTVTMASELMPAQAVSYAVQAQPAAVIQAAGTAPMQTVTYMVQADTMPASGYSVQTAPAATISYAAEAAGTAWMPTSGTNVVTAAAISAQPDMHIAYSTTQEAAYGAHNQGVSFAPVQHVMHAEPVYTVTVMDTGSAAAQTVTVRDAALVQAGTNTVSVAPMAELTQAQPVQSQYSAHIVLGEKLSANIGPYETPEMLSAALEAYCGAQVQAGLITQADAERILTQYQ